MLLKFPLLLVGRCVSWYVPKIGSITDESEKLTGFPLFCRENGKAGSRVIFDFINNGNPLELSPDYFVAPNLPQEIAKFNSSRGNLNLAVAVIHSLDMRLEIIEVIVYLRYSLELIRPQKRTEP